MSSPYNCSETSNYYYLTALDHIYISQISTMSAIFLLPLSSEVVFSLFWAKASLENLMKAMHPLLKKSTCTYMDITCTISIHILGGSPIPGNQSLRKMD